NPAAPGCATLGGMRGLRGDFTVLHQAPLGANFYSRVDASLISDGYYLGDLSTDVFTQGTPYLRSTASVFRRDAETYLGLALTYRQDLRYGFRLVGAPERAATGEKLLGPNTLQRLPALTFALPERPLWGKLMAGLSVEMVRIAPLTLETG